MQVKWLRRALENLDDEAAYIAKDSPRVAAEFVVHMRDSAAMLADHPNMGRPGRISGTRELIATRFSYILPYRVRGDIMEVLRLFHTARQWPKRMS
ncbi:MAG: type II toxin-antitoxin system RelE/ParE family toxin [Proteobacteria bacterium]|nr:type II toxin-antitoxin system RelE/ParE family toxin [Pseudomonadota bacterium]